MTRIHLRLFGGYQLFCDDGRVCSLGTDKERALLAYLVLEAADRPIRRDTLSDLFWEGYTVETARHSLRNALYNLRKVLGSIEILHTTRHEVRLIVPNPGFWCDVLDFQALLEQASHGPLLVRQTRLREARGLARGAFLEGFHLWDCPKFTAWQASRQRQLAQSAEWIDQEVEAYSARERRSRQRSRLPRALTPFFGREAEIELLAAKVIDPAYPLITITGEGGIGKTRLAIALAERVREHFADGVWFVSLAGIKSLPQHEDGSQILATNEGLTASIGEALSIASGGSLTRQQLFRALQDKSLLLILDNFEHIDSHEGIIVDLLQTCPRVSLVVTARKRLDLQAEVVFRLHGLPVPRESSVSQPGTTTEDKMSSLRLFAERADRVTGGFALDEDNVRDVIRICTIVEGMPLAIELAAALVERLTCAQIADAVEAGCDVLATAMRDVSSGHRSLRAAFDTSWTMLSVEEMMALARCTVFHGGFTEQSALAVVGTTPEVLRSLVDKSLLRLSDTSRYGMHEVVRHFSAERLALMEGEPTASQSAHCAYYADYFTEREQLLANEPDASHQAMEEYLNARAAWRWATAAHDHVALHKLVRGVSLIYYLRGLLREAANALEESADALRPAGATDAEIQGIYGRILVEQSFFAERLGRITEAVSQAEESVQLGRLLGDAYLEAAGCLRLAAIRWVQEDYPATWQASQRGLELATRLGELRLQIIGLSALGNLLAQQRDIDGSLRYHEEALAVALHGGQRRLASIIASNLGNNYLTKGDLHKVRSYYIQALAIGREMHNPQNTALAQRSLCRLALALGDFHQALREGQQALEIFDEIGDAVSLRRISVDLAAAAFWRQNYITALHLCEQVLEQTDKGWAHYASIQASILCGWIFYNQGQLDQATANCQRALALAEPINATLEIALAHGCLAQIALGREDFPAAMREVETVLPMLDTLEFDPVMDPLVAYLACYRVLRCVGDGRRAQDVLQAAWQRLQTMAGTLPDEADRPGFLQGVPVHRELVELITHL